MLQQTSSCIRGRLQGEGSTDSSDPDEGRLGLEDDSFCSASIWIYPSVSSSSKQII